MTITIDVSPQAEGPLREQADRSGLALSEYVRRLVEGSAIYEAVVFMTPDGEAFPVSDAAVDARDIAVASERTLAKIWDTPEEDAGCRALLAGT